MNFTGASLIEANFKNSNLFEANFTSANILNAQFEGANLNNAIWTDGKKCGIDSIGHVKSNLKHNNMFIKKIKTNINKG